MGQNFSCTKQVGHRLDRQEVRRQRAGDLWNEDGSICVEDGSICICKQIKGKSKTKKTSTTCSSTRTVPIREIIWIDVELGAQFDQAYPVAKKLNTLLRHGQLPREEDGAIEFWRLKDDLRNEFEHSQYWFDDMWKSKMAGGGGNKKRIRYCTDPSGQEILYLRALQGHSGRNPIDPSLQDNVLIPNIFFEYILSYWMCNQFTFHQKFRTDTGRTNFEQENRRYSLQRWIPWIGITGIRKSLIWPNHVLHRTSKSGKGTRIRCIGSTKQLAQRKGLKFYRTRCNAIILHDTFPAYCISIVVVMKSEEIKYQKVHVSPRPPPKISNKDNWMKELDSEVAGSSKDSQRI